MWAMSYGSSSIAFEVLRGESDAMETFVNPSTNIFTLFFSSTHFFSNRPLAFFFIEPSTHFIHFCFPFHPNTQTGLRISHILSRASETGSPTNRSGSNKTRGQGSFGPSTGGPDLQGSLQTAELTKKEQTAYLIRLFY